MRLASSSAGISRYRSGISDWTGADEGMTSHWLAPAPYCGGRDSPGRASYAHGSHVSSELHRSLLGFIEPLLRPATASRVVVMGNSYELLAVRGMRSVLDLSGRRGRSVLIRLVGSSAQRYRAGGRCRPPATISPVGTMVPVASTRRRKFVGSSRRPRMTS